MNINAINELIFNTILNNSEAILQNGGYIINGCHFNLFDTDTLNGELLHDIPEYTEMMYTLDKNKNYVFISINGLNIIPKSNIKMPYIESPKKEAIILYSKSKFIKIKEIISKFRKYSSVETYEEIDGNIDIYEELFIEIEQCIQLNIKFKTNYLLGDIKAILDISDDNLLKITKFSEKFKIPKNIIKFNINLIAMAYSNYYIENKPFNLYVEHIYNHVLNLTIEKYVYLANNNKVKNIADICYKEFLNLQNDVLKIGEICEFILYFIGRYKQFSKQTCGSLFGAFFGTIFKQSPIHIAKKKQLIDLTNRAKLERSKYDIKQKQTHDSLKKFQMLKQLIDTVNEDINYIKELYKFQFLTILHAFIEYPLIATYFKRKINSEQPNNLLYQLHTKLQNCTVSNYIDLFPSLMDTFTTLTKEEKETGCSYIATIYANKKLEDIEINPNRGTIVENILCSIHELYSIHENTDVEKNIALILYVAIYSYL